MSNCSFSRQKESFFSYKMPFVTHTNTILSPFPWRYCLYFLNLVSSSKDDKTTSHNVYEGWVMHVCLWFIWQLRSYPQPDYVLPPPPVWMARGTLGGDGLSCNSPIWYTFPLCHHSPTTKFTKNPCSCFILICYWNLWQIPRFFEFLVDSL